VHPRLDVRRKGATVRAVSDARQVGRQAVSQLRRHLVRGVAELLKRDPERLSSAIELGLVRREWLDDPAGEPISTATTTEVLERWLERSVEQRPSLLAHLGLSTIQVLSSGADDDADGHTTRLAVAFTDLQGFTAYTAREGDEVASRLLADHHRMVGPVVRSRGGRVVKRLGDGLLLTFPEPEAGVLACLELVEASPPPLLLRAGVHVGDVVVTRDDVIGHVVNVAARVADSARGGEVLITGEVRDAMGELRGVRAGRARRRHFKGLGESVLVCRAEWG
jgi:adenylate cyclase